MNKNKNEETENGEWKNVNLIQNRYYKCQRNITNQTKNVIKSEHIPEIYHEILFHLNCTSIIYAFKNGHKIRPKMSAKPVYDKCCYKFASGPLKDCWLRLREQLRVNWVRKMNKKYFKLYNWLMRFIFKWPKDEI